MNVELKFLNASHFYEHFNYSKVEKLTRLKEANQSHTMKKEREREKERGETRGIVQSCRLETKCKN